MKERNQVTQENQKMVAKLGNGAKIGQVGEHFTDHQDKDTRFRNISSVWTSQCMTFAQGREQLANAQKIIKDWHLPLSAWRPTVDSNGRFALQLLEGPSQGRTFVPTEHALKNIAVVGETSDWMLKDLNVDKVSNLKKHENGVKFHRDHTDSELMVRIVEHSLFNASRMDQQKPRLFRTWEDGTLRALLSNQYAIVNNEWYLAVLEDLIPGGLLSHWRGDADTIFGNVLIPDTIREESDSAYGGMLSIGNSEIGIRRLLSMPSIFRAICMNGCIWDQGKGDCVRKVHRGAVDLSTLKYTIKTNLDKQIPLLPEGIKHMLGLRGRGFGNVNPIQMLSALAKQMRIAKKNMIGIKEAFEVETAILGEQALTAFGLVQAVTRYGQKCTDQEWFDFDLLGGKLTMQNDKQWNSLRTLGSSITDDDEVEKLIGKV